MAKEPKDSSKEEKHGPKLQDKGPGKGLPLANHTAPVLSEIEKEDEPEEKPSTEALPAGLAESFSVLRAELAKPDRTRSNALVKRLQVHIAELQNGKAPKPLDANHLAKTFKKQNEAGRDNRLIALARINRDVAWLLAEFNKLSKSKTKKTDSKPE